MGGDCAVVCVFLITHCYCFLCRPVLKTNFHTALTYVTLEDVFFSCVFSNCSRTVVRKEEQRFRQTNANKRKLKWNFFLISASSGFHSWWRKDFPFRHCFPTNFGGPHRGRSGYNVSTRFYIMRRYMELYLSSPIYHYSVSSRQRAF
jgi:hypothetical protein